MPDDKRDTDREIQIPEEAPTRPDVSRVLCPRCKGEGRVLDVSEWGTQHRAFARLCPTCGGRKTVDRNAVTDHHATRQGRPPRNPGSGT